MYALVEILGNQYKVVEGEKLIIPSIDEKEGDKIIFDKVLLIDKESDVNIGNPTIPDAQIHSTVLEHFKDKKVIVFKKKRRKRYKVTKGHRQKYSVIKIDSISFKDKDNLVLENINGT